VTKLEILDRIGETPIRLKKARSIAEELRDDGEIPI